MPRLISTVLALQLALSPALSLGADPLGTTETEIIGALSQAQKAWERGDWSEVRALLEPFVTKISSLDAEDRQRIISLLADATINDPTLDLSVRSQLVRGYLVRLIEADQEWAMPEGVYSPELFALYLEIRKNFDQVQAQACQADKNACLADLSQSKVERVEQKQDFEALKKDYAEQDIEVRNRVARSRGLALIPFGVGHFYNGNVPAGATFLTAEIAFGAAGLGLLLQRNFGDNCDRIGGTLTCDDTDQKALLRRRKAEEAMGWMFLGTIALDIILAQVFFKPYETTSVERMKRKDLDAGAPSTAGKPRKKRLQKPHATIRPLIGPSRQGARAGVSIRF